MANEITDVDENSVHFFVNEAGSHFVAAGAEIEIAEFVRRVGREKSTTRLYIKVEQPSPARETGVGETGGASKQGRASKRGRG